MKRFLIIALTWGAFGAGVMPVHANDAHHPKAAGQTSYRVEGQIVALDSAASKVQLKHEAVAALDWPAMTMLFRVEDKSQLDSVKVGGKVEFEFVQADGGPLITQIKPAK